MRYIVAYLDEISGKMQFKPFDYKNDALEFMSMQKFKSYLYIKEGE